MMKTCGCCGATLPEEEFYWRNKAKQVRHNACPSCCNRRSANDYRKNPEPYKKRSKINNPVWRAKARKFVSQLKLRCSECGEDHPAVLDFHHLDPSKKEADLGTLVGRGSMGRILIEIKKCIVLCANCHRKFHWNEKQAHVSPLTTNQDKGNWKEDGRSTRPVCAS